MSRYEISCRPMVSAIQIYDTEAGQSLGGKTRYCCSMLLTDLGLSECRLHFVSGRLDHEINSKMFELCKSLGFVQIQLEVPAGTNASRFATFQYSRDELDRYLVKLTETSNE